MTRMSTACCTAAALGFAVSLGAQTTPPSQTTTDQRASTMRSDKGSHEITVTGCLARGSDGNFILNNAHTDDVTSSRSSASSNPTTATSPPTTTANPVGTTGTAPSSAAPYGSASKAMSWKLEGGKDLDQHVGQKIQVTGHTDLTGSSPSTSSTSGSTPATTTGATTSATTGTTAAGEREADAQHGQSTSGPRLDVTSVKMISASCQ
jgi:hypothetical protein